MIERSEILLLLFALIPLSYIAYRRYRRSLPGVLAIAGGSSGQVANLFLIRWFFGALLFFLSLVSIVFAQSGMRWGAEPPVLQPSNVEVVLLFDVSRSMTAEDVLPSRLERSIAVARSIVDRHAGVPFGIVVFKGAGEIFLPVTADTTAVGSYLSAIGTYLITTPGTDIEAGLDRSIDAFPPGSDSRRVLVLFSDGGSLAGRAEDAAAAIGSSGIRVVVVGAGSDSPTPIPDGEGYLVDEKGDRVLTSLDVSELESIASSAGGFYLGLESRDVIEEIGDSIRSIRSPVRLRDRYRVALLVSLVLLALWVTLRSARWKGVF